MRLYRENIALKARLDALERHLIRVETKRKRVSLGVRAAQVFAHLLRRGDEPFQRYLLSAPRTTIMRWAMRFRSLQRRTLNGADRRSTTPSPSSSSRSSARIRLGASGASGRNSGGWVSA